MVSGRASFEGVRPGRWLVLGLLLLAAAAYAQPVLNLDAAEKLATGTVTYVLAVIACVEAGVVVYLFLELRKESRGRLEDSVRSSENAMRIQGESVKLSIKALDSMDVVEKVVERAYPSQRG
jgi:hypothetical protein